MNIWGTRRELKLYHFHPELVFYIFGFSSWLSLEKRVENNGSECLETTEAVDKFTLFI